MARTTEPSLRKRLIEAGTVFTPTTPVQLKELFSGRLTEIASFWSALSVLGQHVVLFGEPGVGKTSLASFVSTALERTVYVTCQKTGTFSQVMEQILGHIDEVVVTTGPGFGAQPKSELRSLAARVSGLTLTAPLVQQLLESATREGSLIVFVDEFDRLPNAGRRAFAEFLKLMSDTATNCSFVLIGIANDVTTLVEEHASIDRCLHQIRMPRMSASEIDNIVVKGFNTLALDVTRDARVVISDYSKGLPFYTHAICLYAARSAIKRRDSHVRLGDVRQAILQLVEEKSASHGEKLKQATNHGQDASYSRVLHAAAACPKDEHGVFTISSFRSVYQSRHSSAPANLTTMVSELSKPTRGEVLVVAGSRQRKVIRFRNPSFEAYLSLEEWANKMR